MRSKGSKSGVERITDARNQPSKCQCNVAAFLDCTGAQRDPDGQFPVYIRDTLFLREQAQD